MESIATGLVAGINASKYLKQQSLMVLPKETLLGALLDTISDKNKKDFQPTNVNMGLLPPLVPHMKRKKRERNKAHFERSLDTLKKRKMGV